MIIYKIVLALFIFGAVVGGMNASEIFSYKLPTASGATISEAQIKEIANSTRPGSVSAFTMVDVMVKIIPILLQGILAVVTIIPLMGTYGIPFYFTGMLQVGIWFALAFGIYELWTGNTGVEK